MDELIVTYPFRKFGDDLNYCYDNGLMYQSDMTNVVEYDECYFDNYVNRENTDIAIKLNVARTSIAAKYCDCVLDVGVGSGEFIKKSRIKVYGYDINPLGVKWLKERGLFIDPYVKVPSEVEGFTLWDTLEHIPNPQAFFRCIEPRRYLMVSLPVFDDVERVRESKHYKPNEHLYYYTRHGLVRFLDDSGFDFVEYTDDETEAGREGIGTFVFLRR